MLDSANLTGSLLPSSPTKRTHHSSPTDTCAKATADRSPPVSRTKLADSEDLVAMSLAKENGLEDKVEPPVQLVRPSSTSMSQLDINATIGKVPRQADADEQTRRLMEMTIEESESLSRLASQHHQSSYNASKRINLPPPPVQIYPTTTSNLEPLPVSTPAPLAKRPTFLQRSLSSPTSSASNAPREETTTSQRSPIGLSTSSWSLFKNATAGWAGDFKSNSVPPLAHPTPSDSLLDNTIQVPLSVPASTSTLANLLSTSLSPGVFNFSFNNKSTAPSTPPIIETPHQFQPTELRTALLDATANDADVIGLIGGEPIIPTKEMSQKAESVAIDRSGSMIASTPGSGTATPNLVQGLLPGMTMINGVPVKTSVSHPMNVSHVIPPEFLPAIAARLFASASILPTPPVDLASPFLIERPFGPDLHEYTSGAPTSEINPPETMVTMDAFPLGNFLLSSCPGKKVRLTTNTGPGGGLVKGGRSAICRDLETDLRRCQKEGAKKIICCLGDEELAYLGAPWSDYSRLSTELSLPVLRIPMVEGYAPFSPASLDVHLSSLILEQSLQGSSILSQCRGGQGRAGTVAVCWLIKMGLIGDGVNEVGRHQLEDCMKVVERVIEVIRRRRGLKAIETPQHVHFILEYVKYLKSSAQVYKAFEIVTPP